MAAGWPCSGEAANLPQLLWCAQNTQPALLRPPSAAQPLRGAVQHSCSTGGMGMAPTPRGCTSSAGGYRCGVQRQRGGRSCRRECHMPSSWGDAPGPSGGQPGRGTPHRRPGAARAGAQPGNHGHAQEAAAGEWLFHTGGSSKSAEIFWQLMHHLQKTPCSPQPPLHPCILLNPVARKVLKASARRNCCNDLTLLSIFSAATDKC